MVCQLLSPEILGVYVMLKYLVWNQKLSQMWPKFYLVLCEIEIIKENNKVQEIVP